MPGQKKQGAVHEVAVCQFCGSRLSLLQRISKQQFCSSDHRAEYLREQERLALACLREAMQPAWTAVELPVGPEEGSADFGAAEEAPAGVPVPEERGEAGDPDPAECGFVIQEPNVPEPPGGVRWDQEQAALPSAALPPEWKLGSGAEPVDLPEPESSGRAAETDVEEAAGLAPAAYWVAFPQGRPRGPLGPRMEGPEETRIEWTWSLETIVRGRGTQLPAPRGLMRARLRLRDREAEPLLDPVGCGFGQQQKAWQPELRAISPPAGGGEE